MTTASKESVTFDVLTIMEGRDRFTHTIALAYWASGINVPNPVHDTDNARKLRETFGDLFIKHGATAEPLPTLRESIGPLLDQIRELGADFGMHSRGMNPKTKAWAAAQLSFIAGARALADISGNRALVGALDSRAVYMASFGRPAFTVHLEEGGAEAPTALASQR